MLRGKTVFSASVFGFQWESFQRFSFQVWPQPVCFSNSGSAFRFQVSGLFRSPSRPAAILHSAFCILHFGKLAFRNFQVSGFSFFLRPHSALRNPQLSGFKSQPFHPSAVRQFCIHHSSFRGLSLPAEPESAAADVDSVSSATAGRGAKLPTEKCLRLCRRLYRLISKRPRELGLATESPTLPAALGIHLEHAARTRREEEALDREVYLVKDTLHFVFLAVLDERSGEQAGRRRNFEQQAIGLPKERGRR